MYNKTGDNMYNINDCVLIRKTNIFPENGIIETPLHALAYEFGTSSIIGEVLIDKLREKYPNPEKLTEEIKKYGIFFETYRSTIHFTINGVVANSLYGTFNYPYAIIEPLKYHILDESLLGLRVEDTYFNDDMKLSNEAIILIPEDEVYELEERYNLNNLRIRTYTENIEDAIKDLLQELGYDFFVVNDHGYRDGLSSNTKDAEMYKYIFEYSKKHSISQKRHFYSDIKIEDQDKRLEEAEKIDIMHLKFILESGLVNNKLVEEILTLLEDRFYYRKEFNELISKMIDEIGLDNLLTLTEQFNKNIIEERNKRKEQSKKL